jgi:hypothetical protein
MTQRRKFRVYHELSFVKANATLIVSGKVLTTERLEVFWK